VKAARPFMATSIEVKSIVHACKDSAYPAGGSASELHRIRRRDHDSFLAQSGPTEMSTICPLSGAKRTFARKGSRLSPRRHHHFRSWFSSVQQESLDLVDKPLPRWFFRKWHMVL
jgi:hypothetical protein